VRTATLLWVMALAPAARSQDGAAQPLVVSIEGPELVAPVSEAVHTVCVINRGNEAVKGVTLRASLPPVLQYRNRTTGTALRWDGVDLAPGEIRRYSFMTRTPAEGMGKLEATAYLANAVVGGALSRKIQVVKGPLVLANLGKTGSPACAGKRHSLSVEISNPSASPVTGIQLEVPIPEGMEYVSAAGPTPASRVDGGGRVRFDPISTMHPGDRLTFILQFRILRPGPVPCAAAVAFDGAPRSILEERWTEVRPAAPDGSVWLTLDTRSEGSGEAVTPDVVFIDGKPLAPGAPVQEGSRRIEVMKMGYRKFEGTLEITDPLQEGRVRLSLTLVPKPRPLMLNLQDKNTGAPLSPDSVLWITRGGSSPVKEGDSVSPGAGRIRIEKKGYRDIEEDIVIGPDEAPHILRYSMVPR